MEPHACWHFLIKVPIYTFNQKLLKIKWNSNQTTTDQHRTSTTRSSETVIKQLQINTEQVTTRSSETVIKQLQINTEQVTTRSSETVIKQLQINTEQVTTRSSKTVIKQLQINTEQVTTSSSQVTTCTTYSSHIIVRSNGWYRWLSCVGCLGSSLLLHVQRYYIISRLSSILTHVKILQLLFLGVLVPTCAALLTAINYVITVLEWQVLMCHSTPVY